MGDSLAWKEREAGRFADGRYRRVPWYAETWACGLEIINHFAHVSEDDPSKLAYTPDERHGAEDRQLRTKPGRYLNKYFGSVLSAQEIQTWAGRWAEANESSDLQLATTPDDIERLYTAAGHESGVGACMSHDAGEYSGPCHPVRVYGAGDLGVAFIGTFEHPKARALVRLEPKVYGRIYGDAFRLRSALEAEGYERDSGGGFDGAKLLRIEFGSDGLVGPYLDNGYSATDCGSHLIMDRGGDLGAQETNGTFQNGPSDHCVSCGTGIPEEEVYWGYDETYCESCFFESFTYCAKCGETISHEDAEQYQDESYCSSCADRVSFRCDHCEERRPMEEHRTVEGDSWCEACFGKHARMCDHCEDWYDEDGNEHFETVDDDESWCEYCVQREAVECKECHCYVSDGRLSEDGRCEDCEDEAEEDANRDQITFPFVESRLEPGPGVVWVPVGAMGSLWCDTALRQSPAQAHVRSGAVTLWGVSEEPIGELHPCCVCGKVQLECNTNYHQT